MSAVGLTMPSDNLQELQKRMNQYVSEQKIDLTKGANFTDRRSPYTQRCNH